MYKAWRRLLRSNMQQHITAKNLREGAQRKELTWETGRRGSRTSRSRSARDSPARDGRQHSARARSDAARCRSRRTTRSSTSCRVGGEAEGHE